MSFKLANGTPCLVISGPTMNLALQIFASNWASKMEAQSIQPLQVVYRPSRLIGHAVEANLVYSIASKASTPPVLT